MPGRRVAAIAIAVAFGPLAALAAAPAALLNQLPAASRQALAPMFMANAIGQTGLNGQRAGTPEQLLTQLRQSLSQAGYAEQPIRTTIGAWGFSATWAAPKGTSVDGTASGQEAVLVTQATALAPGKLNLNLRFEGVAPLQSSQPQTEQKESQPTGLSLPKRLF